MDSMPVNWEALDTLIIDFAKSENLIEDSVTCTSSSSPSSSPSSSSYHQRLIIRQIRRSLEVGDIDAATDLLRVHAPFILDDHRFLFRLQKQVIITLCLASEKNVGKWNSEYCNFHFSLETAANELKISLENVTCYLYFLSVFWIKIVHFCCF